MENRNEERERLQREELKNKPAGTVRDAFNQASHTSPNVSGMSWKETGVLIIVLVVGFIGYQIFF